MHVAMSYRNLFVIKLRGFRVQGFGWQFIVSGLGFRAKSTAVYPRPMKPSPLHLQKWPVSLGWALHRSKTVVLCLESARRSMVSSLINSLEAFRNVGKYVGAGNPDGGPNEYQTGVSVEGRSALPFLVAGTLKEMVKTLVSDIKGNVPTYRNCCLQFKRLVWTGGAAWLDILIVLPLREEVAGSHKSGTQEHLVYVFRILT